MRLNSTELKILSSSSDSTFEGVLAVKEKEGNFWKKSEVVNQRWCRLIRNILFYMKTDSKDSETCGLYILENHSVIREGPTSFSLNFDSEEKVIFIAASVEDANNWISYLEKTSYQLLRNQYQELLKKFQRLQESTA